MFRNALIGSFVGLLVLSAGMGGVAWWGADEARAQLTRTRLATDVLQEYLRLRAEIYRVFTRMAEAVETPGRVTEVREAEERARMTEQIDRVRVGIGREVAFVGSDEEAELARLAEIERGLLYIFGQFRQAKALIASGRAPEAEAVLDRALREATGNGFRELVEAAVREEEAEAFEAHATAARALSLVAWLSRLAALAVVLLGGVALLLLLRRLRGPLLALTDAAEAVHAGDYGRRVAIADRGGEFARVASSFNAMVARVAEGRATLEEAQRGLEAAVAARTAELEEANARLSEADALRRRFLADISHELRTPLTVIRGEAEITLRGADRDGAEYRTVLGRILEQAVHTGRLVDDLLFLARAAAGAPRLRTQPVRLDALVQRVVAEMASVAGRAGLSLAFAAEAREATVLADPGRVRQLVVILLDNAIRYSEPGGAVTVAVAQGPGTVVLRVADRGIGIDAEELPRVFDRFWRGAHAHDRHGEGSGLGLPLAKVIAEAHDGRIGLESRPGQGTTVTVSLPAAPPALRSVA